MPRILIVDDEPRFLRSVLFLLGDLGSLTGVLTYDEGVRELENSRFDLIVVDYKIENRSGLDIVRIASLLPSRPACILVSAYAEKEMAIQAANMHVHAIFEKPMKSASFRESVQRALRAAAEIRPSNETRLKRLIKLDAKYRKAVFPDGKSCPLTELEFRILKALSEQSGGRVERELLIRQIWGVRAQARNVLDTHLSNLRKKVPLLNDLVQSVRGGGYVIE